MNVPRNINSFQQTILRKVFISTIRIIIMKGHYEFLQPLKRLTEAYNRFENAVWALNVAMLSIAIYCLMELAGITGFMSFYYQDNIILATSPAILSAILGLVAATAIRRRRRIDVFNLLQSELSEKTRTAYDNREVDSLPMQDLARELKASLNTINPSKILDTRPIKGRMLAIALLSVAAIVLAQSEIVTPSDFQTLSDIRDKALSMIDNENQMQNKSHEINLTGNIFGKPSLAVLNENKMEIMLYPGIGAGSLARNTEPVERVFQKSQAGEAAAVPSELYIESLPPENKDIIKKYFTILSQSSG